MTRTRLTSRSHCSFSFAITTPSTIGVARRFLNSNPVCLKSVSHLLNKGYTRTTASANSIPNRLAIFAVPLSKAR